MLSQKLSPPDRKSCFNSSMARYKKNYGEQAKLNETFHVFVKKYELAYRGPNTAFHQIQSPIKKIRKNCVEYCTCMTAWYAYIFMQTHAHDMHYA